MKKTNEASGVDKMSEAEIDSYLVQLSETVMWQALLRRIRVKDYYAIGSIATLDPFKQPTELARCQGKRMMAYEIENDVNVAVTRKKKLEAEQEKFEK